MRVTISQNLLDGFVPCQGRRTALPRRFMATFESPNPAEGALEMEVHADEWGRPACTRLTVHAREGTAVTGEVLRRVPVGRLLELAATEAAVVVENVGNGTARLGPPVSESDLDAIEASFAPGARKPRRGSPDEAEHLARVAAIYKAAQQSAAKRHASTEAVGLAMNVSRSTAGRWVAMARKRGLLDRLDDQQAACRANRP